MEAARLQVVVGAETKAAEAGLRSFNDRLKNVARGMTSTGTAMTVGLTAPLMAMAGAALKSAGDFEQSMNVLQQVTGASANTMAALQAQALDLGATTVFSAGEAAEGMLALAKAGMDTEQVMAAIPGVMSLAAAANVGLGEAAGITAAALNAFGLEATESARVADMLAAGANASAADITDLAAGLQQAGFAFDMANQPIENLVASLAILTNVGLTGSDAGTALKNAFMRMMNPTAEAAALMKDLNISFYDAQGNMQALPAIIDTLNAAMANLTPQQRDAALATIFLSDGMKAMVPLLDAGSAGFNTMVGTVTQAGAASDVAGARMQGLNGAIEYLKGSVDSFLIGAALPFLDTLGGLARGAADALTAFGTLPAPILSTSLAIAGILAATGPVLVILGALTGAIAAVGAPVAALVVALAGLGAAFAADLGGIQGLVATVAGQVQQGFSQMLASAQQLGAGLSTAFSKTSFPDLQALWEQFKAGDFQTVADTIRNTAYELMVNLDTELNITATAKGLAATLQARAAEIDQWGTQILDAVGVSIANIDWRQISLNTAGLLQAIALSISTVDWSGLGNSLATNLGSAISDAMARVGEGGKAQWAQQLDQGFNTAIAAIDWNALWSSSGAVEASMRQAVADFETGFAAGLADLPKLDWAVYVDGLAWSDFVPEKMAWATYVDSLSWDDFVTMISWTNFVTSLDWNGFVASLVWSSFVPDINWDGFIPSFNWGDWVPSLDWSRFIPWLGALGGGGGSTDSPNLSSGGSIGGNAAGTSFWRGGPTWVGEEGPEIVNLPRGSRVYNSEDSLAMAGSNGMTINVNVASLNNDMDLESLARKLARKFQQKIR